MDIYLSEYGNDTSVGGIDTPIRSFDEVLKRIQDLDETATVYLMSGVFRIKDTIVMKNIKNSRASRLRCPRFFISLLLPSGGLLLFCRISPTEEQTAGRSALR